MAKILAILANFPCLFGSHLPEDYHSEWGAGMDG